jgi:predicted O-linked N-acetylglucosamine transferase (SPINDLY family)
MEFAPAGCNGHLFVIQIPYGLRSDAALRSLVCVLNAELEIKLQRAVALHGQGQPEQAALLYTEILHAYPDHPDSLHLLGVTETQLGRPRAGLQWILKALALDPDQPAAIANQGNALLALGSAAEALACYDRALSRWPDYPLAIYGRGNALSALSRPAEALLCFERALDLAPSFLQAHIARGGTLHKLGRHADALAAYERALELSPANAKALTERGHVLSDLRLTSGAIEAFDRALAIDPTCTAAWFSRGLALSLQARFAEAVASLQNVLDMVPDHPYARGACLHARLQLCDWSGHAAQVSAVEAAVERDEPVDFPFSFLAVSDSPALQLQCARRFAALQYAGQPAPRRDVHKPRERIRVAYISGDFLEHPTSYLMAGVFEKHDRQRFEILGISLRDDENSPTARRVKAAFERVVVAGPQPEAELARHIRQLDVDIAVDLMGYTGEHRTGIFNYRPAPIQVNYLGFPATMGSAHIDYLIADEFLIPETHRSGYSESIAYLPDCFQANDDRRPVAAEMPTRERMGLPAQGLVWCSFHSSYKLNPPMFDIWARLLLAVEGSVLWLVGGNPLVENNLRREALSRGVEPRRLVFAQPLPYPQHLARLPLADLCLDTLPFNGGTTSSDALWAGVPVLTCAGNSFAARMSGSLLHAVGLPDLVTHSLAEYEQLALQLARTPGRLADLRTTLARNRGCTALFDTDKFRRHLEAAYASMVERYRQGRGPATFRVRDLEPRAF